MIIYPFTPSDSGHKKLVPWNHSYVNHALGPLSAPIGVEGNAFLATKYANSSWPDIQITFIASHPGFDGGTLYKNFLKIKTEVSR